MQWERKHSLTGVEEKILRWHCIKQCIQMNILFNACLQILTVFTTVSMHGVRRTLMEVQAASAGLPLVTVDLPEEPSMPEYELMLLDKVNALKTSGCTKAIFGDIFLEDLKIYREQKLKEANIECVFPLWKIDTMELMKEFIGLDFKAIVVCVNENYLDKSFCGKIINESFINDLPANVDVCGENGEFHSYVFDGPIFKEPIQFYKGEIVYKKYEAPKNTDNELKSDPAKYGFYFCDLLPV